MWERAGKGPRKGGGGGGSRGRLHGWQHVQVGRWCCTGTVRALRTPGMRAPRPTGGATSSAQCACTVVLSWSGKSGASSGNPDAAPPSSAAAAAGVAATSATVAAAVPAVASAAALPRSSRLPWLSGPIKFVPTDASSAEKERDTLSRKLSGCDCGHG
eukprot:364933-Chlamydomonas_euryale.AAC.2